jgi:hypothetical protein
MLPGYRSLSRTVGVLVDIRTDNLLNTSRKRCRYWPTDLPVATDEADDGCGAQRIS